MIPTSLASKCSPVLDASHDMFKLHVPYLFDYKPSDFSVNLNNLK